MFSTVFSIDSENISAFDPCGCDDDNVGIPSCGCDDAPDSCSCDDTCSCDDSHCEESCGCDDHYCE